MTKVIEVRPTTLEEEVQLKVDEIVVTSGFPKQQTQASSYSSGRGRKGCSMLESIQELEEGAGLVTRKEGMLRSRVGGFQRWSKTTNKSQDLLVEAKAWCWSKEGGLVQEQIEAGGDLRWISGKEGRVGNLRDFLDQESKLEEEFLGRCNRGQKDPREELLERLAVEEMTLELADENDDDISQEILDDLEEMSDAGLDPDVTRKKRKRIQLRCNDGKTNRHSKSSTKVDEGLVVGPGGPSNLSSGETADPGGGFGLGYGAENDECHDVLGETGPPNGWNETRETGGGMKDVRSGTDMYDEKILEMIQKNTKQGKIEKFVSKNVSFEPKTETMTGHGIVGGMGEDGGGLRMKTTADGPSKNRDVSLTKIQKKTKAKAKKGGAKSKSGKEAKPASKQRGIQNFFPFNLEGQDDGGNPMGLMKTSSYTS